MARSSLDALRPPGSPPREIMLEKPVLRRFAARVARALRTRPTARDGVELLLAAVASALILGPLGTATGLLTPVPADGLARIALVALVFPALAEELVFRGALIPDRTETPHAGRAIAVPTLLFVLWHVLEAYTVFPGARGLLTRPDFLLSAGVLGLLCALLRRRSGSLWTAVALHWAAVVVWKSGLGGPL